MTRYRLGSAAGATGPTAFLPPGKHHRKSFSDQWLVKHGAAPGSTIVMTPNGYMTEDAWLKIAPRMAEGIRGLPVVCERPDWWVLKIIDGFGAHTSSVEAMDIYANSKILLLKEEADSSHVCQSYDQKVAKDDKKSLRDSLGFLRTVGNVTKTSSSTDGWQLIHVGLAAIRQLDPNSWTHSFKKVNLHPHHRVSFPDWCTRIAHFLQGGQSFKPEVLQDKYNLLPSFWHGMLPEEKSHAMAILASHGGSYSVACAREMISVLHVPASDLQNLRLCMELAADRTHPTSSVACLRRWRLV